MLEIGSLIGGHFQVEEKIHEGPLSDVFRGKNTNSGVNVAIKVAGPKHHHGIDRLKNEAHILKSLHHPHVVKLLYTGSQDDCSFMVLEYLEGGSINQIVPKDKGLPLNQIWPYFKQILEGVQTVHDHGFVHLDIKPTNVFLAKKTDKKSIVKILDFGIARKENEHPPKDEKPIGTPGYSAPEQILGKDPLDRRTDVYALGSLLAFLLTGQQPFIGKKPEEILAQQLGDSIAVLKNAHLENSVQLQHAIQRAMSSEPKKRYSGAKDLEHTIELLAALIKEDRPGPRQE